MSICLPGKAWKMVQPQQSCYSRWSEQILRGRFCARLAGYSCRKCGQYEESFIDKIFDESVIKARHFAVMAVFRCGCGRIYSFGYIPVFGLYPTHFFSRLSPDG